MTDKQLKDRAIKFKGSDYVQVKDRVLYLAENYDWRYSIDQEYEYFEDSKMWVVKTVLFIRDEKHEHQCHYIWLAQEIEWTSFINSTSALENACTSSLGRAIACLWIGVIDSFASMNEVEKAESKKEQQTNLPRFNKEELEQLKWNSDRAKEYQTSDELIKAIEKKYRISKEMKMKIADYRASL